MGWSDSKKRAQLTAPEARLLVVTGKVGSCTLQSKTRRGSALVCPPIQNQQRALSRTGCLCRQRRSTTHGERANLGMRLALLPVG